MNKAYSDSTVKGVVCAEAAVVLCMHISYTRKGSILKKDNITMITNKENGVFNEEYRIFDELLERYPNVYNTEKLRNEWMQRYLGFLNGTKTLPLTYDPIFKQIFNVYMHKDRLESFVSSILHMNIKIIDVLQSGHQFTAEKSLVVMDLVVELEDGSITNIEIQKVPYDFPPERASCYSADLLMRQK